MALEIDVHLIEIDDCSPAQLAEELASAAVLNLYVPMPSIGYAGDHISIAEDYGDALYVGELLSKFDPNVAVAQTYDAPTHKTSTRFTFRIRRPAELAPLICQLLPWFAPDVFEEELHEEMRRQVHHQILKLTDELPFRKVCLPELADAYMLNRVNWMSYEVVVDGDAADWEEQLPKQPECRFGFIRSSHSHDLNGDCFCSPRTWIISDSADLGSFLTSYGGHSAEARRLLPASLMHESKGMILSNGRVAVRPASKPFTDALEMLLQTHRASVVEPFTYRLSADGSALFAHFANWTIIDFNANQRLLDQQQLEEVLKKTEENTELLRACLGRPTDLRCNWESLSDEAFEALCWDVLYDCGQYERTSLKKFGLSRSRDGGRDIQAERKRPMQSPERFIFQCKRITTGRSLGGNKVSVSDVVDQYGAQGFGVMTCTAVDATLHDKLDGIRASRGISTDVWDLLRIERFLGDHLHIRDRHFGR